MRQLFRELKRRNVYRVAVTYAAAAFVTLQAAKLVFPATTLEGAYDKLVLVAFVGFPIALVIAWAFELTPEGVRRTSAAEDSAAPEGATPGGTDGASSSEPPPPDGRRSRSRVALSALVGLGLVGAAIAGGWYLMGGGGETGPGISERTVAVLPFETSGPGTGTWREGMVTMLGIGLDGAVGLRAIADQTVLAAWERSARPPTRSGIPHFLRAAREAGAEYAVVGSAVKMGGELRFSADVHRTRTGDRLGRAAVRGEPERAPALADSLARRLLGVLVEESGRGLPSVNLSSLTTESLDALKRYLEGERRFRAGEYQAAAERFRAAVRRDSGFALAYARLASSQGMVSGSFLAGADHWERAYRLSDRLPPRERGVVRAWNLVENRGRALAAADTLRRLTERYPDDPWPWSRLGEVLWHADVPRGLPEAERAFERAVRLDSTVAVYHPHLVSLAFSFRHDSALAARRIAAQPPSETRELNRLSMDLVFGSGAHRREALARLDTLSVRFDEAPFWPLFNNLLHPTDARLAARAFRRLARRDDLPPTAARGSRRHLLLATVAQGRIDEAVGLARDLDLGPPSRRVFRGPLLQGWPVPDSVLAPLFAPSEIGRDASPGDWLASAVYLIQRGRFDELPRLKRRFRERFAALADSTRNPRMAALTRAVVPQWNHEVEGYRAWRAGRLEQAAERWSGSPILSGGPTGIWRGDLYRERGELDRAEGWYLTEWFYPAAQRRLGRLYEEMGEPEKAAAAYGRFVEAWEKADEGLQPRVEKARRRLQQLTASGGEAGG